MVGIQLEDVRHSLRSEVLEYLAAVDAFEKASHRFNKACHDVRMVLKDVGPCRCVVKSDNGLVLVTADADGSFDVQPIEVV